jgi:hypothetical protein
MAMQVDARLVLEQAVHLSHHRAVLDHDGALCQRIRPGAAG